MQVDARRNKTLEITRSSRVLRHFADRVDDLPLSADCIQSHRFYQKVVFVEAWVLLVQLLSTVHIPAFSLPLSSNHNPLFAFKNFADGLSEWERIAGG